METRASYLLVGAFVLVLVAGLAGFVVWLVGGVADEAAALYRIVFTSSVTGLQEGSQVRYRGVPVGRVREIRLDPDDIGRVVVLAEITDRAPVRKNTVATLEMLGVTGIAYVQLAGGTEDSPPLVPEPGQPVPIIPGEPSALEQVFQSTPELLAQGVEVMARLTEVLDEANLEALGGTLRNLEAITAAFAGPAGGVGGLVEEATEAAASVQVAAAELAGLAEQMRAVTDNLGERSVVVADETVETMRRTQTAVAELGEAAAQLEALVTELRGPLGDFAEAGLYDFSQLIGETRLLVAGLSRITKEIERNPAGFLLGTNRGGFEAR